MELVDIVIFLVIAAVCFYSGSRMVESMRPDRLAARRARLLGKATTASERAQVLEAVRASQDTPVLLEAIKENVFTLCGDSETAVCAAGMLLEVETEDASSVLGLLQSHMDWEDRVELIGLLEKRGSAIALTRLLRVIESACHEPLPNVARAGVEALGRFNEVSCSPAIDQVLLRCLHSGFERLSLSALEALGVLGSLTTVPEIRRASGLRPLQLAAQTAVEQIGERYQLAPSGALALAKSEPGGHLSLPTAPGALTLSNSNDDSESSR